MFGWLAFAVGAMVLGKRGRARPDGRLAGRLGRGRAGADDARARELQAAGFRGGPDPVAERHPSQPGVPLGGQQRRPDAGSAEGRHEPPQPARRPGQGRRGLEGRPLGARPVRHQGRPGQGEGQGQADHGRDRGHPDGLPEPAGRGGRHRERDLRARKELQEGLRDRGAADDPDHAADPARRIRLARRGMPPGRARVLGGARVARPLRARHERLQRRLSDDLLRDPADRDGRRGGLLAVLHPP